MSKIKGKKRVKNFSHAPEKIDYPGPRIYGYADKVQNVQGRKKLISYQVPNVNADKEMKVIQAVILREKHKSILMERVSKHKVFCVALPSGKLQIDEETLHAVQDLQVSTIKMLESVESWRLELTRTYPFIWEQKNYVQSLARDMDIVYFNKEMKRYLRRGSKKNPFLTPKLQLSELYDILCRAIIAKITKIDNSANRQAIEQVDNVMALFAPGITRLQLRDAIKMILEEQETWGPADGVMVAPVWASDAQEARNRLLGSGGRSNDKMDSSSTDKAKNKNIKSNKAKPIIVARNGLYKQRLKMEKPKQKPFSKQYKFGLKKHNQYFVFIVQDVSPGKTKVNVYSLQTRKSYEFVVLRSELKKAFIGNSNVIRQLKNKKMKYRIIVDNLSISQTNMLHFDYNRVRNLMFKKSKKKNEKVPRVQYCTYKAAVKIGYFWCAVILKFLPTMTQTQIIICPLLYPSIKQLLKVKDEIVDAIRSAIISQRTTQQGLNNAILNEEKKNVTGLQMNNRNASKNTNKRRKKKKKDNVDVQEKVAKTGNTPLTSTAATLNSRLVTNLGKTNDDSSSKQQLAKIEHLEIIKVFLFECLICAGSPPVFFIQEPFTSRPNTRIRDQIEQIEAGIPFYSRPSTREIYTPTLAQNFVVPENGIMDEVIPLRPPQISRELENIYVNNNTQNNMIGDFKETDSNDANAGGKTNEYIQSTALSNTYYVRYAMKALNGKMYLIHMHTDIFSENKTTVSLRMYPIYTEAKRKIQKQNIKYKIKELYFSFDRLTVERLYVNNDEYVNDFNEGRDDLLKLAKLLKNHLNVINCNHVVLENLRILKTPEHLKPTSKKFICDRYGIQVPIQPPIEEKKKVKQPSERKKTKTRKLDMQLMPIFKPMLARQLSAEGHKRAKRPYTAKTWRDHQHSARTFLRKLAGEAKARAVQEAQTDEHVGKQSYARYWLTQKAKEAMVLVKRRENARKGLASFVSEERARLHRNILKNTKERQEKTNHGTTVMTITMLK